MVTWTGTLLSLRAVPMTWQQHNPTLPCDGLSSVTATGTAPSDGPTGGVFTGGDGERTEPDERRHAEQAEKRSHTDT